MIMKEPSPMPSIPYKSPVIPFLVHVANTPHTERRYLLSYPMITARDLRSRKIGVSRISATTTIRSHARRCGFVPESWLLPGPTASQPLSDWNTLQHIHKSSQCYIVFRICNYPSYINYQWV
jgi:hypothetical protein